MIARIINLLALLVAILMVTSTGSIEIMSTKTMIVSIITFLMVSINTTLLNLLLKEIATSIII